MKKPIQKPEPKMRPKRTREEIRRVAQELLWLDLQEAIRTETPPPLPYDENDPLVQRMEEDLLGLDEPDEEDEREWDERFKSSAKKTKGTKKKKVVKSAKKPKAAKKNKGETNANRKNSLRRSNRR